MELNYVEMGRRVRYFRKMRHLSQAQLAEMANISVVYASHIETGIAKPSLPVLINIAYALETSVDEIIYDIPPFPCSNTPGVTDKFLASLRPNEREILLRNMEALKAILDDCLS